MTQENSTSKTKYKTILFKVSGEALMGKQDFGIDPETTARIAADIAEAKKLGVQIALMVGGGNIFRGVSLATKGIDRVSADHMGMLATVMNAIAMKIALNAVGVEAVVLSAIELTTFCETFTQRGLDSHMKAGRVVVFAGGSGHPFFTSDTPAALRACEMKADAIVKGTQVDGIYTADPKTDPNATRFDTLTYSDFLSRGLKVMDTSAVALARDQEIDIVVFSLKEKGGLAKVLKGEATCTTVTV